MPIKAIVFDLDGTLLDQEGGERAALERLLNEDVKLSPMPHFSAFLRVWRNSADEYLNRYLLGKIGFEEQRSLRMQDTHAQFGSQITIEEATRLSQKYLENYKLEWRLYDEALPLLDALKGKYRLGMITNGDSDQQRAKLARCGITAYFESIVVSSEVGAAKPDAAIFRASEKALGLKAEEIAYVGDRLDLDAKGSRDAGWKAFWLDRKHMPGGSEESGIEILSSLKELPDRLN